MSNQQIQKVKVKRLAHVGLWSTDVPAQVRYYQQVLGLDIRLLPERDTEQEAGAVFLVLGDEHHCLALFNDTRSTAGNSRQLTSPGKLHHLSFEVDTDAELAALAARLKMSGVNPEVATRDGNSELGDALWFNDPDGNRIEISVTTDEVLAASSGTRHVRHALLRPTALQHVALHTMHLEEMVDFYTEALGFDISDWLLRECAWLRCNNNHHALILMQGQPGIDHIGYSITSGSELLQWADHLSRQQVAILWGPGRHGAGNDLFLRFADTEGLQIELSAELQQYYDRDVTTPPRLWHTRSIALNLWGAMPSWLREEVEV